VSGSDSGQEDRTEAATPRRLQRAREAGQVPLSRELSSLAGLAGASLALLMLGAYAATDLARRMVPFLGRPLTIDLSGGVAGVWHDVAIAVLRAAGPMSFAAVAAAAAAVLVQTGALINLTPLIPQASRISPRAGLRRLFGADGLMESLKSVAKIGVLVALAGWVLRGDLRALLASPFADAATLAARCAAPIRHVLVLVLVMQTVIAGADLVWVRLRHAHGTRMSRQDIRDEQKESEGDPKVRQRFRQLRFQRARRRMLAAVPKATVVITNPTHYAVALVYDRARNAAPRVVAKGVDSMAARIREMAQDHHVPLISNPLLARALYRVELETEIPAEHYKAVAEIIAYVWRLARPQRGSVARAA